MTTETDQDIIIEPDAPVRPAPQAAEEPKVEVVKTEEAEKPKIVEPEEGLEVLKGQLEAEKAARQAAEQARQAAEARAASAQGDKHDSDIQMVTSAIESVKQAQASLKKDYAEAAAQGDYAKLADLQEEMSTNAARRLTLETGLESLKNQPKPKPQPIIEPVEKLASDMSNSGYHRSAAWIRAHPEYASDPRLYQGMLAAHNLATAVQGLQPDTDAYFEAVERSLGIRQAPAVDPGDDAALSEAAHAAQQRVSPPAAPVSRGVNGAGSVPTRVRLTQEQREAAEMSGQSYEEYARQLIALQKEGRLN
jgi:colicin import membrane protein